MREILYFQAGSLANYIGTHFWNTQQEYFTYSEDEDPFVGHDISFRAGLTFKGEDTYCPRLLAFDRKSNFGTLARSNGSFEPEENNDPNPWDGSVVEYKQKQILQSAYQTRLEEASDENESFSAAASDIRYWSDFNRVSYVPRTMQMLPDVPEWQNTEGDWIFGQESFQRYNEETDLMEGSVRAFLEECNSFQGMQMVNDASTFGAFSHSFMVAFRDELSTAPCLSFPLISNAVQWDVSLESVRDTRKIISDALYLRGLNELALLTIPIQHPGAWYQEGCTQGLKFNDTSYHASAILSAHIESATIPLRLKNSREDISSFTAQLNWHGPHRFGQLSGILPLISSTNLPATRAVNFSAPHDISQAIYFARRNVTRGFSASDIHAYDTWSSSSSIKEFPVTSTHAPPYPLPSSFPDIFQDESIFSVRRNSGTAAKSPTDTPSVPLLSSLFTTSSSARLFADYAKFVHRVVKRKRSGALFSDIVENIDELNELVNDLWTIHDGYDAAADTESLDEDTLDHLDEDEE